MKLPLAGPLHVTPNTSSHAMMEAQPYLYPKGPVKQAVMPSHQHHRGLSYLFDLPAPCACKDDSLSSVVIGSHRGHPILLIHKKRGPLDGDSPTQRLVKILATEIVVDLQWLSEENREMSFLPMPRDMPDLPDSHQPSPTSTPSATAAPSLAPPVPAFLPHQPKGKDELMLPQNSLSTDVRHLGHIQGMQPLSASEQALQTKPKALSPLYLTEQHLRTQQEPAQHPCSPSIPDIAISDTWDAGTSSRAHTHPSPPHPHVGFKKKTARQ